MTLENTELMTWSIAEIEGLVMKRPRLGIALLWPHPDHNVG